MRTTMRGRAVRGFALVEAVAVVVVVGLLAAVLAMSAGESRRLARLGEDVAKLRQIGAWTGSYAADNSDQFWTFSWKKGQSLSQYPDLNNAASDLQAAANQAVDILRRVAGRTDIQPITDWFPYTTYSGLVLQDYLKAVPPEAAYLSAADAPRLTWARNPAGFDAGLYQPAPASAGTNFGKRWPYSSSLMLSTSFFDGSSVGERIDQGGSHAAYHVLGGFNASLGTTAQVAFASSKVHLHDASPRHFGPKTGYCTSEGARLPFLFTDGAVAVRAAAGSSYGWQPNQPSSATPELFLYQPDGWEPPPAVASTSEYVYGRFRWTRGGIAGRDFGGPEVCTGQPGCP